MIGDIKELSSNEQLLEFWDKTKILGLKDGLSSIMAESGSSLLALFGTKEKAAGEEMANKLYFWPFYS